MPNVEFEKIVASEEFVVAANERGNCTAVEYIGNESLVHIPTTRFNTSLSAENLYVVGDTGWSTIDAIAANVFGSGIESVHLTDAIVAVEDGASH